MNLVNGPNAEDLLKLMQVRESDSDSDSDSDSQFAFRWLQTVSLWSPPKDPLKKCSLRTFLSISPLK